MLQGDGLGSVFTRCMDECQEAVPDAWFAELLPSDLAEKYRKFVLFSFVEHNQCVPMRVCARCRVPRLDMGSACARSAPQVLPLVLATRL